MVSPDVLPEFASIGIIEGRSFLEGTWFENVAKGTGDTDRNLVVENPADSGVYLVLSGPTIIPTGACTTTPTKNVDNISGTELDPVNPRTDGSDSALGIVYEDATYTGGTELFTSELPSGQANKQATATNQNAFVIGPGDNLVTDVNNISAATINISIQLAWIETLEKNLPPAWSP